MSTNEYSEESLTGDSGPPSGPDGFRGEPGDAPAPDFLYEYLQQRTDSLSVSQSDLERFLSGDERFWVLTRANERIVDVLSEPSAWSADTLGTIESDQVVLLRPSRETEPNYPPTVGIPVGKTDLYGKDDILTIVSAAVIRGTSSKIEKVQQILQPMFVVEYDDSRSLVVLHDSRYQNPYDYTVKGHMMNEIGTHMSISKWLNEISEKILVDKKTGQIISDLSVVKNKSNMLKSMDSTSSKDVPLGVGALSTVDSLLNQTQPNGTQFSKVGGGIATTIFAVLLFAPVDLSDSLYSVTGLIAFGILVVSIVSSDTKNE